MTIFRMPDPLIRRTMTNTFELLHIQQTTVAEGSVYERRDIPSDVRWQFNLSMRNIDKHRWAMLEAFKDKVMGESGFFTAYDPANAYPRGRPQENYDEREFRSGHVFSNNLGFARRGGQPAFHVPNPPYGSPGTDAILVKNVLPNSLCLRVGDHLSIMHGRIPMLHKALKDAYSDASGIVEIEIAPRLRGIVMEDAEVTFTRARGVFQFSDRFNVTRKPANLANANFSAREVPEVLDIPGIMVDP